MTFKLHIFGTVLARSDTFEHDRILISGVRRHGAVGFEVFHENSNSQGLDYRYSYLFKAPPKIPKRPVSEVFHPRSKPRYSK